jgi:two-component system sensor histidine kinase/response regulator
VNLVGNAIKFTQKGEVVLRVRVVSREKGRAVLSLSVSDTGIGIPKEKRDVVFEAFTQADGSTTRKFGGTGLGLAICSKLVKIMGGKIALESDSGKGSTFEVELPFELQKSETGRATVPPEDLAGRAVLVVESNAVAREILREVLDELGMKVMAAADGKAALAAANEKRPELSVVSASLPGDDAFALADAIRMATGSTIVMVLTSLEQSEGAVRCREVGIGAYVTKPVKPQRLVDAARAALSLAHDAGEPSSAPKKKRIGRALKVLVAEDSAVNRKLFHRILEKHGHEVTTVADGGAAFEAATTRSFDVALMDIQMPVMDGLEAAQSIRKAEKKKGSHLPLIAVTAHAMRGDRERCIKAGFDGYVVKPVEVDALFAEIERLVPDSQAIMTATLPPPRRSSDHARAAVTSESAIFDPAVAMKRAGDDAELAKELAGLFLEECPKWLADLKRGLDVRDAQLATRAAHTIKGAVDHWGARRAFDLALRLERLGRDEKLEEARPVVTELEAALRALFPALRTFIDGA